MTDAVAKPCPFCGSSDTVKDSDFSTSLMVGRHYCRRCRSLFEAVKWGDASQQLDLPDFLGSVARTDTEQH